MPFFDAAIPAPLVKAFVGGKANRASEYTSKVVKGTATPSMETEKHRYKQKQKQKRIISHRLSWAKLGNSLSGSRSRREVRRHSCFELGEHPATTSSLHKHKSTLSPWLEPLENPDLASWSSDMQNHIEDARGPSLSVPESYSVEDPYSIAPHYHSSRVSSEGSDSDYTAVPTDGSVTPANTLSRSSSYKKDILDATVEDEDECATVVLTPEQPAAVPSEPNADLGSIKLVGRPVLPKDDFFDPATTGMRVFRPLHPAIAFDGE